MQKEGGQTPLPPALAFLEAGSGCLGNSLAVGLGENVLSAGWRCNYRFLFSSQEAGHFLSPSELASSRDNPVSVQERQRDKETETPTTIERWGIVPFLSHPAHGTG